MNQYYQKEKNLNNLISNELQTQENSEIINSEDNFTFDDLKNSPNQMLKKQMKKTYLSLILTNNLTLFNKLKTQLKSTNYKMKLKMMQKHKITKIKINKKSKKQ